MVVDNKLSGLTPGLTPQVGGLDSVKSDSKQSGAVTGGPSFGDVLGSKVVDAAKLGTAKATDPKTDGVKFSQHALERLTSRGISFRAEDLMKLNDAVDKVAQKGSSASLVLMGENAFIVSVKNRTVVTAMDREAMKDNVFTNIDSTVIL